MAAVIDSWKTTNIAQNYGRLYRSVAVPSAGARPTVASGILDSGVAIHMGATKSGSKVMAKTSLQKYSVDEFRAPIITAIDTVEAGLAGELVGVTDMELMAYLLPGTGTRSTAAGYDYVTMGAKTIVYDCVCLTFELIEDKTKSGWFMLYSALNDTGVEFAQARKEFGGAPFSFVGYEVTSRATADTLGQFGKTVT